MGTPEGNGSKNFSVRRNLANGLSIALMGISSALGMVSCSSVEKNDSQEGNNIEIPLSDYPSNEENFILDDRRTNQEKIEIVKSVAPDDYRKEAALLAGEWERMGRDESDLEIVASIVDGKSWVLVARSRGDGRVFVPRINGVIQASLHLFGRLDEAGDFFDLVPVGVEGATVVGDESGWHVVARVEGGAVTEWYDAAADEVRVVERAEPSPTPDARFQDLLPETLAEVREENVIREDHLEEDLATLLEKERQALTDPSSIEPFTTGITEFEEEEKAPSVHTIDVSRGEANPVLSISYMEIEGGRGVYVLGVALKRPGSEETGILHFAVDPEAARQLLATKYGEDNYDKYFNLQKNYEGVRSNGYKSLLISVVLWRGYAEEGGVWDPLLDLNPGIADLYGENGWKLNMYVGGQSLDRETNEWVTVAEYGEEKLVSELERMILPAVSIGVIY